MKKTKDIADSDSAPPTMTVRRKAGHPVGQSDDLTFEELQRILAIPDKRKKEQLRDYAVLLVFANTPMRQGEIRSLTVGDLLNEGKRQYLTYVGLKKRSKKKYWLKIPIERGVYEGILRYVQNEYKGKNIDHSAPMFLTLGKHGPYAKRRITKRAIERLIQKYRRKAGIEKRITPHSFRATFVTLREGIAPGTLIKLTGHADIKGLSPYARTTRQKVEDAALSRHVT